MAKLLEKEELTPRWAAFLPLYIESGNAYQSAIQAGFSHEYANVITTRFPTKVRKSLAAALEEKGIGSEVVAERIRTLLYATKPVWVKGENGVNEMIDEGPDYQAIDKGLTHTLKIGIGGGYAPEKSLIAHVEIPASPRIIALAEKLNK